MNTADKQIIRLTLDSKLEYLPGATAFAREILSKLGLQDRDIRRMELSLEEACVNVIENAFEGESGNFDILISRRPGQIVVGVEDRGLPLDFKKLEENQESGLGMVLMKAMADEVHFLNLGRQGKRVEMIKNLPEKDIATLMQDAQVKNSSLNWQSTDITYRLMLPEETIKLARCAYRCYGYTYSTDNFYYPERFREMVKSGLMISIVAVDPAGEIVGHVAVAKDTPEALVGEDCAAIVDPRCRGMGILNTMAARASEITKTRGILGTFAEGVTVHAYSQKTLLSMGGKETGVLLGFTPASMYFKSIQGEENHKRRPIAFYYTRRNPEPFREVYTPAQHNGILTRIYSNTGLNRKLTTTAIPDLPERSQVNVKVQTEASRAFMRVREYGADLETVIRFRLKELCSKRIDIIFLDIPLCHPYVQRCCASLEMLGFFFGAVLPELDNGDFLRLQYINNAELELADVHFATGFSKELFQYVCKAGNL